MSSQRKTRRTTLQPILFFLSQIKNFLYYRKIWFILLNDDVSQLKTKKELEKLELRKSNFQNDLMDRAITSHDYQDIKGRVDKEMVLIEDKLTELNQEVSPFRIYIQKEVPMSENLLEYYRKSDGATKKKILNTIFAE